MADISKIKLPNGTTYNIKDLISGYQTAANVTSTLLTYDESLVHIYPIVISGSTATMYVSTDFDNVLTFTAFATSVDSHGKPIYRHIISSTQARNYVPFYAQTTPTQEVILISIEGDTIHIVDLTDSGSGLIGTYSTVTIPTIPTNVSYFVNDSGYTVASVQNTTLYLSNSVTNGDDVGY